MKRKKEKKRKENRWSEQIKFHTHFAPDKVSSHLLAFLDQLMLSDICERVKLNGSLVSDQLLQSNHSSMHSLHQLHHQKTWDQKTRDRETAPQNSLNRQAVLYH